MGGATRFMTLLTAPFPPLRPSLIILHRRFSSISTTPLRLLTLYSPSKTKTKTTTHLLVKSFHSQPNNNAFTLPSSAPQQKHHHPWPEWTNFLNVLSNLQGFSAPGALGIPPEDAFVVYEELSDEFVSAAAACLAFARAEPNLLGLLSWTDIVAVVSNGTPFLFKSALDTGRRMRTFLGTDGSDVSDFDKANTVDLMKYILSYVSNPTVSSERNGLYSRELVDSSVRNLLHELGTVCFRVPTGNMSASGHQFSGRDGQAQKPFGQNIEMKRGDWICPKCNFMNFARNMKCLECEEHRPKKQLSGGEWECPECTFFNYGRNMVCLRCDSRRPGAPLLNTNNSQFGSGQNGDYSYKTNLDNRLAENGENAQRWFSKNSQMNNATDINGAASDKNSTPLFQSGASNFQYPGSSNSNHVPFVPLRANTFSRGDQISEIDDGQNVPASSNIINRTSISSNSQSLGENFQFPKDSASQIEDIQGKEVEQAEKSERWFKKMAELHNVKDLPSAVSDEDFPEIMPIRKGENRFVVSKRKDRSLTSPKYKRQVAMDQANNTNFVPFVPFPPGYFAKKDTEQQPSGPNSAVSETSSSKILPETQKLDNLTSSVNLNFSGENSADSREVPRVHNQPMNSTLRFPDGNVALPGGSTVQGSMMSNTINSNTARSDGYSRTGNASSAESQGASFQSPNNENVRSSWTGKSLEGSAVKETDPLDMSEEAKAERWFKRVAQIKDISELSQIPDEDFPSIMPMRKGVNRFVVSKRKTPLERRLTSQQYRRNLPIVTTDSVKKESDDN